MTPRVVHTAEVPSRLGRHGLSPGRWREGHDAEAQQQPSTISSSSSRKQCTLQALAPLVALLLVLGLAGTQKLRGPSLATLSRSRKVGALGEALPPPGNASSYVAICVAVKDEHCDIREWILHHASSGVGKFYLADTQSAQPMKAVLEDLISSGLVEYSYVTPADFEDLKEPGPGHSYNWQIPVYKRCLKQAQHHWIAFIDADEFIILDPAVPSLPALLQRYEQYGGLQLHWRPFASSGHNTRPTQGVLQSYTACCTTYKTSVTKAVVQPAWALGPTTVHYFRYRDGRFAVNTAGARLDNGDDSKKLSEASYEGAALHHYISKSRQDFERKMQRRSGNGAQKDWDDFNIYEEKCDARCTQAVAAGERLWREHDLTRNVPQQCFAGRLPVESA